MFKHKARRTCFAASPQYWKTAEEATTHDILGAVNSPRQKVNKFYLPGRVMEKQQM